MTKKQHSGILRSAASVTGLLILSKALGMVKQMVVAGAFGTTLETDLINLSQGFIGNLHYILSSILATALVSIYVRSRQEDDAFARRFAGNTLKAFSLIAALLAAVTALLAPLLSRILAPDYDVAEHAALSHYLCLFAPVIVLYAWSSVFQALLNANRDFAVSESIRVHQSVIVIVSVLLLAGSLGVQTLVVSFFVYTVCNMLYLGYHARGLLSRGDGNPFRDNNVRTLFRLSGPLLLGYSLVYINQIVDKMLSSGLDTGTVTALGYAAILSDLIATLIASVVRVLFSYSASYIAAGKTQQAADVTTQGAKLLILLALPVSVLTVLCAKDIVTVIYGRGAFGAESIRICALALQGYGLSFVPAALRVVYSHFQYAHQDTRQPMINSSIGIVCNIVLSIALCPHFGVLGIAAATSVSELVVGSLDFYFSRKRHPELDGHWLLCLAPQFILGICICFASAKLCGHLLAQQGSLVRFAATTALALIIYLPVIGRQLLHALKSLRGNAPELEETA